MEILEAYDLTGSFQAAAELCGCDPQTVRRYVRLREAGEVPADKRHRSRPIDPYMDKIEELVHVSKGRIRADKVFERIKALGFTGSDRACRRAVAEAKADFKAGHRRVYRPWVTEPGLWAQWDWGEGPRIDDRRTFLWCAWLAWSRFRVVIPVWDKTLPTVTACIDVTLRRFGGAPVYMLTDNEKTVTVEHVAGVAVRNPEIVEVARHYGMTIKTCLPADPETKGGSEHTVKIAKADIVPTATNLRGQYRTFGELETACRQFCETVNNRPHRITRRKPVEMLAAEAERLHRLPKEPFAAAFGTTRRVKWDSTVSVEGAFYSVPHQLIDTRVWVRWAGDELVVTAVIEGESREVARHDRTPPGNPSINDEHYPPRSDGERTPKATSAEEAAFLAIGPGAAAWLTEAGASGTRRIRPKMAEAVALSKLHGAEAVDKALGTAAIAGRFAEGDLISILDYQARSLGSERTAPSETHSLQHGTGSWAAFGMNPDTTQESE